MSVLLCGAARRVITPPVGTALYGYQPGVFSTSVHDDLTATALALGDGHSSAMLISLTLGDLQTALCGEMKREASAVSGIPADHITVASTHTHSAPNVSGMEGWGEIDRGYIDGILMPAIRDAAREAAASMTPAEMGYAVGDSLVGVNRRVTFPDGSVDFGQDPDAPFDPAMTVIRFRRADDGRGILNLVHYGCHGTACGMHHEITRDWSGLMIDRLEAESDTLSVYFNGAVGDVGPRISNGKTTGDITYVEELGRKAAADALRVYGLIRDYTAPAFSLHSGIVHIPRRPLPPLEDVREALNGFTDPDSLVNIDRLQYVHLKETETALEAGAPAGAAVPDFTFQQTQVRVGDILFVPCPFEPFTDICLRLRAASGVPCTLTLSCANGYEGYLPTQGELERGGYEVGVFRYVALHPLTDDADSRLITESLRILSENGDMI